MILKTRRKCRQTPMKMSAKMNDDGLVVTMSYE
jgi:hypothetical protein